MRARHILGHKLIYTDSCADIHRFMYRVLLLLWDYTYYGTTHILGEHTPIHVSTFSFKNILSN